MLLSSSKLLSRQTFKNARSVNAAAPVDGLLRLAVRIFQ
jgi:hypothetical protein